MQIGEMLLPSHGNIVLVFLSFRWMRSRLKTGSYFHWRKNWRHRQAMCRSCSCKRKLWMNSSFWWRRQSVTWAVPRERSQEGLEMVRSTAAALYAGFTGLCKTVAWMCVSFCHTFSGPRKTFPVIHYRQVNVHGVFRGHASWTELCTAGFHQLF